MVKSIKAVEPIIKEVDGEAEMVECKLEWDEENQVFVNVDSEEGWMLDEHLHQQESYYVVDEEEFDSIERAQDEALKETDLTHSDVSIRHQFRRQ